MKKDKLNPKWKKFVNQANDLDGLKKRQGNEEKGLRDLEAGAYLSDQDKKTDSSQ